MRDPQRSATEPVDALARGFDRATSLLVSSRYPELEDHISQLEQQAVTLRSLKQSLESGARAPVGLRESCLRLGNRIAVLSEVAGTVAVLETGLLQPPAPPAEGAYDREGNTSAVHSSSFRREA